MAYYGLLLYLVILYLRPADWIPLLTGVPVEAAVIVISLVLGLWSHDPARRRPVIVWLLVGWLAVIFVGNFLVGSGQAVELTFLYFKRGMLFVFVFLALDTTKKLRGFMMLSVILGAVMGLQAISQVQSGVGWAGQPLYWGGRASWIGMWDGANVLSLLLLGSVPFALDVITGRWGLLSRVVATGSMALIVTGMFLANSRGGYLALAAAMLVYFRQRVGWKGIVIGAVAVALLFAFGPSRLAEIGSADSSARTRVDMWSEGLDMFKSSPLLGVGKGQFTEHSRDLVAHNVMIQNLSETGLVGFFFWLGMVYLSLKGLWAVVRASDRLPAELASASQALLASFCGYLAASMFINTDFDLLYVVLGLCAAAIDLAQRNGLPELEIKLDPVTRYQIVGLEFLILAGMYVVTATISEL